MGDSQSNMVHVVSPPVPINLLMWIFPKQICTKQGVKVISHKFKILIYPYLAASHQPSKKHSGESSEIFPC